MARLLLAVAMLFAVACDGLPPPPEAGPSPTGGVNEPADETTPTPTDCHDLSAAEAGEAVVVMLDNEFEPACFAISSTQGVQLANNGSTQHNFSIAEDVDIDVEPGANVNSDPFEDLTGPGTFEFFCKYHQDAGMIGVIVVE